MTQEEINLTRILVAIFLIVIYAAIGFIHTIIVEDRITSYGQKTNKMLSITLIQFIRRNETYIKYTCSLLFPLYWYFSFGALFGNKVYDILIDNEDENRIASWVV